MSKENIKKKLEEYSYKEIVNLGKAFLNAANKCNEPSIELIGFSHPLLVPIITNRVFACELFLKAILKHNNKKVKKHKLAELFEELPRSIKSKIIGSENKEEFDEKLENISNLFVEWRYLYECYPSSVEYKFLCDFTEKLLKFIDSIQ